MSKTSAGLLVFRERGPLVEVLLVHPGGPLWARKDEGAWSIPKGLVEGEEDPLACARREFAEELGVSAGEGPFFSLGEVTLKSRKRVLAWAAAHDLDVERIVSNTFEMEWPPRSGTRRSFPEVDRAGWFPPDEAKRKLNPAQAPFVDRLLEGLERQRGS